MSSPIRSTVARTGTVSLLREARTVRSRYSAFPRPARPTPMPTITNTTKRPVVVPLPQGKKLHLGPAKSGEVTAKALEHPPLVELVEAGTIEVDESGRRGSGSSGGRGRGGGAVRDQTTRNPIRRTGDG